MQEIGEDLVNILDTLRVKVVIGLGEGITRYIYIIICNPGRLAHSFFPILFQLFVCFFWFIYLHLGAGANIMLRFGAMHVTRCLGVVCINPNEVAMSMLDSLMVSENFWKYFL